MASPEETRVKNLESELSLLKNQVQQTLLDIREHVLEFTNPFTAEARLVRAWQERTAQAAQTNLGGETDLESLLETDGEVSEGAFEPDTATATAPPPADDDDWDEFEDEELLDVAPQATAAADDDLELDLEPEEYESEPEAQPVAEVEDEPLEDGMWEDPYDDGEYEEEYEDEHEDDLGVDDGVVDEIAEIEVEDDEVVDVEQPIAEGRHPDHLQDQAVGVHQRRVAIYHIDFRVTLKELHDGGDGIDAEVCIVGVDPADNVAPTPSEGFIQRMRLTSVGFTAPRYMFRRLAEDVEGLVRRTAIHHDVFDVRVCLAGDRLKVIAEPTSLVEGGRKDGDERATRQGRAAHPRHSFVCFAEKTAL